MAANEVPWAEVQVDAPLVRRLLEAQMPQWARLPLRPVTSGGTDNAMFRLGDELVVRLPMLERAVAAVEKEQRWLPVLGPQLPLAVPEPVAVGSPGGGYPWPWSVYRWLPGENPEPETLDREHAADALADFIAALQQIDASDGPCGTPERGYRALPLVGRDARTRTCIRQLQHRYDPEVFSMAWDRALEAPEWDGPPTWMHSDLHALNLLAVDGRLTAVIDFGSLVVGDPSCELMVAWTLLDEPARSRFRRRLDVDDATWARGRGWALSWGAIGLAFYEHTNVPLATVCRRGIDAALADHLAR